MTDVALGRAVAELSLSTKVDDLCYDTISDVALLLPEPSVLCK